MNETPTIKYTFPKKEKLCGKKSTDALFASGQSFIAYPLRVVYIVEKASEDDEKIASVLTNVSKRKFKRANKRNRVKRLIREAYRLNKLPIRSLLEANNLKMDIAFLYLKDELPTFGEIEKAMLKTVNQLSEKIGGGSE